MSLITHTYALLFSECATTFPWNVIQLPNSATTCYWNVDIYIIRPQLILANSHQVLYAIMTYTYIHIGE